MDLEELTTLLMSQVDSALPEGVGVALVLFDFGNEQGQICYASNADRRDMYRALRNLLEHWKNGNWIGDWNGGLN